MLVRLVIFGGCFMLFYGLMAVNNWPLRHLSRTSGTTALTWAALGLAMIAVFGELPLGRRRKRLIVGAQMLGAAITDAVTYLQLQIMNVNPNNHARLTLFGSDFAWLLLCLALQLALVTAAVCAGETLCRRMQKPRRALLVFHDEAAADALLQKLKKQRPWQVEAFLRYDAPVLDSAIDRAETVFLAPDVPHDRRDAILHRCYQQQKDVLCKASVTDVLLSSAKPVILDDAAFLEMNASAITLGQRIVKRTMDIVLSAAALLVLWPVMAVIALVVRLSDGGPALFYQERLTASGRKFTISKFRTMRPGAANASACRADSRVTRIGRFLRRSRLDELPQLFNILKGDMSLVGPRPEMMENVRRYKLALPDFAWRERMKAGLTGYAQIEGRYNTSPEDKLLMDLMYIRSYSLFTDVKLLLRTLTVFFKPDSTEGFAPENPDDSSTPPH